VKPSQTRISPTVPGEEGGAGVDVLGCNMRPDPTQSTRGSKASINPRRAARARHQRQLGAVGRRHRRDAQARLIEALHPVIRGWSHSCSTVCRHETFEPRDEQRRQQRRSWSRSRPPNKPLQGGDQKDWRGEEGPRHCRPRARGKRWGVHPETPMQRHVNGQGRRSPDEGDERSWGRRRAHPPGVSRRVARRLKRQDGRWTSGGDAFKAGDVRAGAHRIPRSPGGREAFTHWPR
jgi:RNA-directed DNA polymerase